ncbi:nucleoside deaminase [Azospirillum doebereinerae]|uniref:nucleoside deaminase n=1 Tax=Azospirillum doebereinerae TaxID=92933 RepID=UPI00163CF64A|nr:nucleoside deaminase [Azospirillum doebereinerae]MCG5239322.1 nucleoside deaminase [Azospirillum doebereinerae]
MPPGLEEVRRRLKDDSRDGEPDDTFVRLSCMQALTAAAEGNHGVGAVVVHDGRVVAMGRNRAFHPRVRSDLHAEMDALNALERDHPGLPAVECTLYSSLECCPMCTTRLINVGIGRVLYAADDDECGMIRRFDALPAGYRDLAASRTPPQRFGRAACSAALAAAAADIFRINLETLNQRVLRRE